MAVDAFLKFGGVEGEAVDGRLHDDVRAIGRDFVDVGDDFAKLVGDVSSGHGASDLKIAQDIKLNHDLLKIDGDFLKVSAAFIKFDSEFIKFGDGLSNFVQNDLKITFGDSESPPLADTFQQIDTDLQNTSGAFIKLGADFIKLTSAANPDNVFQVGSDFLKINADLGNLGNDFIVLGDNFLKIAAVSDLKIVDQVFIKFGNDLTTVGQNLNTVSGDFYKIGGDFAALADSETIKLDQAFIKYAGDFLKLDSDFVKLDTSLSSLSTDFLKINEVIHVKFESPPEISQLVQAIATFGGGGGGPAESPPALPSGDTPQQPVLTTPSHG
jgi:hypothetical protein